MKAPKILNIVYSMFHPLTEHLQATEAERGNRGWLLGFFVFSLLIYADVVRNLMEKESFSKLPGTTFIWIMAILSITCLLMSYRWLRVLARLIFKRNEVE